MHYLKRRLGQVRVTFPLPHAVTLEQAAQSVLAWAAESPTACKLVMTPNLSYLRLASKSATFRTDLYKADMVLADGHPVVTLARLAGDPVPERVAGSDLFEKVVTLPGDHQIFLLGSTEDRCKHIIDRTEAMGLRDRIAGFACDQIDNSDDVDDQLVKTINASGASILALGLGAPKQERWAVTHRDQLDVKTVLCIGAGIDFSSGEIKRAPSWAQRNRLEWMCRMLREPRRLGPRYVRDAAALPGLVVQALAVRSRRS